MNRTPRRRTRRPFAKIVRRYWVVAVLLLALAGLGGWRIAGLPVFRPSALHVSKLEHVSRESIVNAARIDPQGNVWFLNRGAIAHRIEAIPYVDTARVRVVPPAAVTIDVSERHIDSCVRDSEAQTYTIDANRHVLETGCNVAAKMTYVLGAPLDVRPGETIRDAELAALMNDGTALMASGDRYKALAYDRLGELRATLQGGVVIKFGEDVDLDRKERLVGPIIAQLGGEAHIAGVDVRAPDTPVIEYRPVAKATPKPVLRPFAHHINKL